MVGVIELGQGVLHKRAGTDNGDVYRVRVAGEQFGRFKWLTEYTQLSKQGLSTYRLARIFYSQEAAEEALALWLLTHGGG